MKNLEIYKAKLKTVEGNRKLAKDKLTITLVAGFFAIFSHESLAFNFGTFTLFFPSWASVKFIFTIF